jgi:hypothetical protein
MGTHFNKHSVASETLHFKVGASSCSGFAVKHVKYLCLTAEHCCRGSICPSPQDTCSESCGGGREDSRVAVLTQVELRWIIRWDNLASFTFCPSLPCRHPPHWDATFLRRHSAPCRSLYALWPWIGDTVGPTQTSLTHSTVIFRKITGNIYMHP